MHKIKNKIFIAGHNGMVGKAILKELIKKGYSKLYTVSKKKLDLRSKKQVDKFLKKNKFDEIYIAAAKVGGIIYNKNYPVDFLLDNLSISINLIQGAFENKVKKILYLGSSCIYPRSTKQPIKEEYLLNSKLEPTNEAYALAKIIALRLCSFYEQQYKNKIDIRCLMPTNLYGPNDRYDISKSHVIPALIKKFYTAKTNNFKKVEILGTGNAIRDFLYVEDLAKFCVHYMNLNKKILKKNNIEFVNVGSGKGIKIKNLIKIIANIVDFKGKTFYNKNSPDGHPKKILDISLAKKLGFQYKTKLEEGIKKTYLDFIKNQ
jgi:GDP-L-fucose synthase